MYEKTWETILQGALWNAELGLPVFPLHWDTSEGCSCGGAPGCTPGDHPMTDHGLADATLDPSTIIRWWSQWPIANIGAPSGMVGGFVAFNIDPENGGDESMAELERQYGPLPATLEALFGLEGRQKLFAYPGFHVPCRNGWRPGVDIKGDGGYIMVEPSMDPSGYEARWELAHLPNGTLLAPMPEWLKELLHDADSEAAAQGNLPIGE